MFPSGSPRSVAPRRTLPRGNILAERVINLLRERGYTFWKQEGRVCTYRHSGSYTRVQVHRTEWTTEDRVREILRHIGMSREEVAAFIATNREPKR